MTELFEALKAHNWIVAIVIGVPIIMQLAKLTGPWLDVTRLPQWAQWIPGALGVGLPVLAAQLSDGTPWPDAAYAAAVAVLTALGGYHTIKRVGGGAKAAGTSIAISAGLLILLCSGCGAGSLEAARTRGQLIPHAAGEVRDSRRCQKLDDEYRHWSGWEQFALAFTGGSGVAQFPVYLLEPRYQDEVTAALAGATIGASVFAAYAADRSNTASESWARECSQ